MFTITCPGDLGVNRYFSSGGKSQKWGGGGLDSLDPRVKLKCFYFDSSI